MARQTYSVELWKAGIATPGFLEGPTVPDGHTWVVRDVTFTKIGWVAGMPTGFCIIETTTGTPIAAKGPGTQLGPIASHWQGRVVLEAGQRLQIRSVDGEWVANVCGYDLTNS